MNPFVILLDGDTAATPRLQGQVSGLRTIAADGGIRHAAPLGLTPEVWLGDFDSVPDGIPHAYENIPRIAYPVDKDVTDGEIAVNEALARGANGLLLVGAFGGKRADHALLHKTMALSLAARNIPVCLSDGRQEGHPILAGKHSFDFSPGCLFSLIGFSALSGLSISGVKWPLGKVTVPFGSSLTLSNEVTGDLRIDLDEGRALLIAQVAN